MAHHRRYPRRLTSPAPAPAVYLPPYASIDDILGILAPSHREDLYRRVREDWAWAEAACIDRVGLENWEVMTASPRSLDPGSTR